jgi:cytochrome c nitrite reductase small subunit
MVTRTAPRTRVAGLVAGTLVGVAAGLGAHTFDYAEGTSYLSNNPKACVNCHVMRDQYDAWQKSSHHAVATCNDCHVPQDPIGKYATKASQGYRHSKAFTLQNFAEPIRITESDLKVVENNCVRCHADLVEHIAHKGSADSIDCTHCHSGIGHDARR